MNKVFPILITSLLSGCGAVNMVNTLSGDVGFWEADFLKHLSYAYDTVYQCNRKLDQDYDLNPVKARLELHSQSKYYDPMSKALTNVVDIESCKIFNERLSTWKTTGKLPLRHGETEDPRWNKELTWIQTK